MRITREYAWDMGHRLKDYEGLCRNLHGHRYVAQVTVDGPIKTDGSEAGMVMDFANLDEAIRRTIGDWDHASMLQDTDPVLNALMRSGLVLRLVAVPWPPTAEHIAYEIATRLSWPTITSVRVYETPRSWAEWSRV